MSFEQAHAAFIQHHLQKRTGERRDRLSRGHREAEKLFCKQIWWPLQGNFDHLHPEYEVLDWRGIPYFCDFAWLTEMIKLVIEIKGFGPHVREMDRTKYSYELNRENFLTALGYQVICFSYDDVAYRPDQCIAILRMVMHRFVPDSTPVELKKVMEREILRLACFLARPLRPIDLESHLGINHRTAVRALQSLCTKGIFEPILGANGKNVVKYALQQDKLYLL